MDIRMDTRIRTGIVFGFAILVCAVFVRFFIARPHDAWRAFVEDGLLHVYFLDIGQGDAIYVRAPDGSDMLVDSGPSAEVLREKLSDVMPPGDRKIDVVVETHPDADHISGFPDILEDFEVGSFLEPGIGSKNSIDDEIKKLVSEKGIRDIRARRGESYKIGPDVSFRILFPDEDVSNYKDTNEASIVAEVVYASTTVLLTGDSPKKIENHLMKLDAAGLRSDILKLGHHGSRTSSGKAFVQAVSPAYAIVSAGEGNRYGHPHKEVLDILRSLHIPVLRTDREGTIEFVSDGKRVWRK
ncbi:MAG TPA: ComEC/Rec2 family competence protein [Candidatus Paceibacterota bacterium]|nr:ComEC/Rec2 family competence protein [Candidatus Paceibacterota bacterium]